VTRSKISVYLQPFLHDLVRLEANRQNRTSSNVAESLILDGLSDSSILMTHSDLASVTGLSLEQVQESVSRLIDWPDGYQWIAFFERWIPIMMEKK
jgi:hypothetical protein